MTEKPSGGRESRINLRIDADLYRSAFEKARALGGLSVVIRTLLRWFVDGRVSLKREDVVDELLPVRPPDSSPRKPRK